MQDLANGAHREPTRENGENVTARVASPTMDRRWFRYVLLVATGATALGILVAPRHAVGAVLVVLACAGTGGVFVCLEHRRPRLGLLPVVAVVGVVMVASVATPPRTSNDLWSYTMYGRTVTAHGASPYEHVPADYPSDPFVKRVSQRWRHRGSVYGPLFVGVAATGALVAGDSPLLSRLYFQILAAIALLAILFVVWRTTRDVAAIAFVGLNPVLAVIVVNGGHNDVMVGLGVLLAAVLAPRRRGILVGVVIGLAVLIKLTAGLALVGVLLWAWRARLKRFAVTVLVTTGLMATIGYLPVIAGASHVLGGADRLVTNASPWNFVVDRILHHDAWRNAPNPLAPNGTLTAVFYLSAALVVVLGGSLGWLAAKEPHPELPVGVTVAAYPLGAEYAFPWYAAWALPVLGAAELTPVTAVVWLQSVVMLAALKLPLPATGSPLQATLRVVLTQIAPPLLLGAFVVVVVRRYRSVAVSAGVGAP